jgi:hypothetical protein
VSNGYDDGDDFTVKFTWAELAQAGVKLSVSGPTLIP